MKVLLFLLFVLPSHCQSIQTIQTMLVFEGLTMTQPVEKSIFVCHRFLLGPGTTPWIASNPLWIMLDQESNDLRDPPWSNHVSGALLLWRYLPKKKQNTKQDPLRSLLLHFCKSIFRASLPTNHPHHSSPVPEDLLHSCFSHLLCQIFICHLLCFSSPWDQAMQLVEAGFL